MYGRVCRRERKREREKENDEEIAAHTHMVDNGIIWMTEKPQKLVYTSYQYPSTIDKETRIATAKSL